MKHVRDGIRYDTETATLIAETNNSGPNISRSDFAFWEASLYATPRSGRFFLAGTGGPMSMFATDLGNRSWSGGSRIIPFEDAAAAYAWAESHLQHKSDFDEIVAKFFPDQVQDA